MTGALAASMAVTAALLSAGCGSHSASPGVASLGGSATTASSSQDATGSAGTGSKATGARAFSQCMRSHGVPSFPDPTSGGGINISPGSGINPNSPQFRAAERTCQKLAPAGKTMTPAQQAKAQQQLLRFSACMRSHGVTHFPDPQFSGGGARVTIGPGSGIDPNSPQFRAAQTACKRYLPGQGKGMSTSTGRVKGGGAADEQPRRP